MARGAALGALIILMMAAMPSGAYDAAPAAARPLDDSVDLTLQPIGVGWARLWFVAETDLTLTLTISHPTIHDLCRFGSGGSGLYDRGHATAVFLHDGEGPAWHDRTFMWIGTPVDPLWPDQTGTCGVLDPIEFSRGSNVELVIADTVGGYSLHLRGSSTGAPTDLLAPLAPHPGFARVDHRSEMKPEPSPIQAAFAQRHTWQDDVHLYPGMFVLGTWEGFQPQDETIHQLGIEKRTQHIGFSTHGNAPPDHPDTTPPTVISEAPDHAGTRRELAFHWSETSVAGYVHYDEVTTGAWAGTTPVAGGFHLAVPFSPPR